ncbi:hypothetical protein NPX13_g9907 [Xylaria arbuscula]|uniref:Zn(2)-C6 fungal-type domain-containing protein n=1 Tax=Xylaria arbuscula TaxID=114810 RepID=A0A9W8N5U6_9PEZI|nr:hypothetical protein NPX13_g9907 [Xylaria arbuscula]
MGPSGTQYADKFKWVNNPHESCLPIQTFDRTFRPLPQRPEQDPGEQTPLPQCRQPGAKYFPPIPIDHHQHPQYDGSYVYMPESPAQIDVIPVAISRRKVPRASQACESCRRLKVKCDEAKPCRNCKERDEKCVYPDVPVKTTPDVRNLLVLTETKLNQRLDKIEELLRSLGPSDKPPNVAISGVKSESEPSEQAARIPPLTLNHTARTSLLLNWPSIQILTADLLKAEGIPSIDDFPIGLEQQPGLFEVFGHGRPANLNLDRRDILSYTQSFERHILNNHPIILPNELRSMVETFLGSSTKAATAQDDVLAIAGTKRKCRGVADHYNHHATFEELGLSGQNINEAVILLVLALGKFCLHSRTIPKDFPQFRSCGLPPPTEPEEDATTAVKNASSRRDFHAIPGIEYFALATTIMSSQVGGYSLEHVHAQILASLYCGQLGRVLDSSFYISSASRTVQILVSMYQDRLFVQNLTFLSCDNQLVLAFWTCLQLENDILAELPLPPSGILQYADKMPYPSSEIMTHQGIVDSVIESYFAQLFLGKQLNEIHILLYSQNRSKNNYSVTVDHIQKGLKASREKWLPRSYHWNDEDPPANDILAARLRAKYCDLQVILYRPFLEHLLHRDQPQIHVGEELLTNARLAIQALIESTKAFYGLKGDQRLTSIFVIAHSRWGNLLILTACHKDRLLWARFVSVAELQNSCSNAGFTMVIIKHNMAKDNPNRTTYWRCSTTDCPFKWTTRYCKDGSCQVKLSANEEQQRHNHHLTPKQTRISGRPNAPNVLWIGIPEVGNSITMQKFVSVHLSREGNEIIPDFNVDDVLSLKKSLGKGFITDTSAGHDVVVHQSVLTMAYAKHTLGTHVEFRNWKWVHDTIDKPNFIPDQLASHPLLVFISTTVCDAPKDTLSIQNFYEKIRFIAMQHGNMRTLLQSRALKGFGSDLKLVLAIDLARYWVKAAKVL